MAKTSRFTSHAEVIANWPDGVPGFASDIGISRKHAQTMKDRDSIPSGYWPRVVNAARGKVKGVTLEALAAIDEAATLGQRSGAA